VRIRSKEILILSGSRLLFKQIPKRTPFFQRLQGALQQGRLYHSVVNNDYQWYKLSPVVFIRIPCLNDYVFDLPFEYYVCH